MAKRKRKIVYSGIGGQAVLEGVMMKNKDDFAIAVRKPNGEIDVDIEVFHGFLQGKAITKIPFIRGTFNLIDSMRIGMRAINHSAAFYDDEEAAPTAVDKTLDKVSGGNSEKILTAITTILSVAIALGLFVALPLYLSSLLKEYVRNDSLLAIIEGGIRIIVFLIYLVSISLMKDIRRLYQYHGAEHKCINCLEHGYELTVNNVKRSSRIHKRCGTSFLFFVVFVSIIVFFFIRVDSTFARLGLRIVLIPVIAGISYEIIRLAGKSDNIFVKIISAPGMLLQRLTTKEPDESMIEVGIRSVEAVFDWRAFLNENFGDLDEYDSTDVTVKIELPEDLDVLASEEEE